MPTIQGKKNKDNMQFITSKDLENMKKKDNNRLEHRFVIVDDGDLADTVVGTPEEIIDFRDTATIAEAPIEKILSREEIKAELDELKIEYNSRLGTEKLLQLLNDNK